MGLVAGPSADTTKGKNPPLQLAFRATKSVHGTVLVQAGQPVESHQPNTTERKQRAE